MPHLSENSQPLAIKNFAPGNQTEFLENIHNFNDVTLIRLPLPDAKTSIVGTGNLIREVVERLGENATLILLGDVTDLVHIHAAINDLLRYQLWIAIKQDLPASTSFKSLLPHQHIGAVVYTRYDRQLEHTKTRIAYTYCPACQKTTKDYGGKKHTYHHYGTLLSDVWRDLSINPEQDINLIVERFADLFGLQPYQELHVYDLAHVLTLNVKTVRPVADRTVFPRTLPSQLLNRDCLDALAELPDNSIDFAFADPPYNLQKSYSGYGDDMEITEYFKWCDRWITEVARVLRPGSTFALLNIPLWSIRHFLHLETLLEFQHWIVWDALSFPVRMIMPAHYTILCFSKGTPRLMPEVASQISLNNGSQIALEPLADGFCIRPQCVSQRRRQQIRDRAILTDLWGDIHRLKHNSRRVDHPCQLPPQLMYRLITRFTQPGEVVLDCFNGAGTTSLAAHQLGRRYLGIERELKYHNLALSRHLEVEQGLDPFRKEDRPLTEKNSPVARLKKQKYEVPKKTLQLEVKRVAQMLGKLPSREDMIRHGLYAIRYYDEYFTSWGEVCAAARTTGMKETREDYTAGTFSQKRLF